MPETETEDRGSLAEEPLPWAGDSGEKDLYDEPAQGNVARGLYGKINISVQTLDKIIVVLLILLVGAIVIGISERGYTVEFNTLGGTSVESQFKMYGESLDETAVPTREGYKFSGWYLDEACTNRWEPGEDTVTGSMTLYAGWEALP